MKHENRVKHLPVQHPPPLPKGMQSRTSINVFLPVDVEEEKKNNSIKIGEEENWIILKGLFFYFSQC